MAKDLRHFLEQYEQDHPEDVVTIEKPLSLASQMESEGAGDTESTTIGSIYTQ